MRIFFLILSGVLAGVFGGMGMGGGTFLIPILMIFFSVDAHAAAVVNLLAFIPTAAASLALHIKNGLVEKNGLLFIVIPALITAVGSFFLAREISSEITGRIFGVFLLILSIISFVSLLSNQKKERALNTPRKKRK